MFGRKKQLAPAPYNRPVAAAYLYAGELAQRAQALVYGEQPLVGEAITNGCVVSEGDGVWQMRTTESPFFGLLLLNFQQLAKALKADPVIQVRGFAYDREGDTYPYPNARHEFENPRQMEAWLEGIGPHHTWYYHVKSLGIRVRARANL